MRAPPRSSIPTKKAPGSARLVDDHDRQPALERGLHGGVVVGHAVEAERADDGVADRDDLGLLAAMPGSSSSS